MTIAGKVMRQHPVTLPFTPIEGAIMGKILTRGGGSVARGVQSWKDEAGLPLKTGSLRIQVNDVQAALHALGSPTLITPGGSSLGPLLWWRVTATAGRRDAPGYIVRHERIKPVYLEFVGADLFVDAGNGWPIAIVPPGVEVPRVEVPVPVPATRVRPALRPPATVPIVLGPPLGLPPNPSSALILGGAACVWEDVRALEALMGRPWDGLVIAANDVGSHWPGRLDHWCTLHPEKLRDWLLLRQEHGYPDGFTVWTVDGKVRKAKKHEPQIEFRTIDNIGAGASGMLGVTVALEVLRCSQVILCGVPMDKSPHFPESRVHGRGKPWQNAEAHWKAWTKKETLAKLLGRVRSMSGRTAELLGMPTAEWLKESEAA